MKFLDDLQLFYNFFMGEYQSKGLEAKKSRSKKENGRYF
jgi:hypothetical protein